jgi:hypothetical protein
VTRQDYCPPPSRRFRAPGCSGAGSCYSSQCVCLDQCARWLRQDLLAASYVKARKSSHLWHQIIVCIEYPRIVTATRFSRRPGTKPLTGCTDLSFAQASEVNVNCHGRVCGAPASVTSYPISKTTA